MEANSVLLDTSLVVSYVIGTDSKGNDVVKNQAIKNLNVSLADEALLDLGDIVGGFISYPIEGVTKKSTHLLSR